MKFHPNAFIYCMLIMCQARNERHHKYFICPQQSYQNLHWIQEGSPAWMLGNKPKVMSLENQVSRAGSRPLVQTRPRPPPCAKGTQTVQNRAKASPDLGCPQGGPDPSSRSLPSSPITPCPTCILNATS